MQFDGFPYYGIWSAKDANFVCLEPWLGIADTETTNGKLEDKEGIIILSAGNNFEATWSLELF
jgi:galactose mutarotase-like enzyme